MTQQKSEDRIVPEGPRKLASTHDVDARLGGGKAVSVQEAARQLSLPFVTAVNSRMDREAKGAATGGDRVPKAECKRKRVGPAQMESVVECLEVAFDKVAANRGAPGPDGQTIRMVRRNLPSVLRDVGVALLAGTYQPGDSRRVSIPKSGGGQRGLSIPNVIDRVVQEAIRMVLEPLYEPAFHPASHGFRPNRSCHTAMAEVLGCVDEGYDWVVDIDLEKFFDRVDHQRLMSRLAMRVADKPLLALVGRLLKAEVVLPDGVRVASDEGVPQGSPLSPLLSNIVLSELDAEIAQRGHRFVRYADDCIILVRSARAGRRVMESITRFLERRLRLRVNANKSAVARLEDRQFLGYRVHPSFDDSPPEILLSERSLQRLNDRVRELTPRNCGRSLASMIERINEYFTGWFGYFHICTGGIERVVRGVDAHLRRRLRAISLKHWKTKRTRARRLVRLGVRWRTAWNCVYKDLQGLWRLSHEPAVERGLRNAFFRERGLIPLLDRFVRHWTAPCAPRQLQLAWDT